MPDNKPPLLLDNRRANVGDFLASRLDGASRFRLATAYFSVYGHDALANQLGDKSPPTQFLFGAPELVGNINAGDQPARPFNLSEEGLEFATGDPLNQSPLAKKCADWVKQSVEIRRLKKGKGFLHGKMYHIASPGGDAAVVGSSNFTRRGLGMSNNPNLELNLVADSPAACAELAKWFDGIWNDGELVEDIKPEVLAELEKYFCDYSPEFVYYKTLFEFFSSRPGGLESPELKTSHLYDSKIWKKLYDFQRHGAKAAIAKLGMCDGCILADSVGLGKTYTALAVAKYFELRNKNVLVLCPKKLENNWRRYSAVYADSSNPFQGDRFGYHVLAHTDLLREKGEVGGIDLAKFNWSAYDLIIIDESHNFRNQSKSRIGDDGVAARRGRYEKLMSAIHQGVKSKVLMLSATPVNNSLMDLQNQIRLITGGNGGAFAESLSVGDVDGTIKAAEKQFKNWEEREEKDKAGLIKSLGGDFFRLLGGITIARSRSQIERFYADFIEEQGKFPVRTPPQNISEGADARNEISYDQLRAHIGRVQFRIYRPSDYVQSADAQKRLDAEKAAYNFNQKTRERFLVAMMQINFLKRLESSVRSSAITLQRAIDKINAQIAQIDAYLKTLKDAEIDGIRPTVADKPSADNGKAADDFAADDEFADDDTASAVQEFVVNSGKAAAYKLSELDVKSWRKDMEADLAALEAALSRVLQITPERDNKLLRLKEQLREKAKSKNRKLLVFTAFKDTADYLREQLRPLAAELKLNLAMVAGDAAHAPDNSGIPNNFNAVLDAFAPLARECEKPGGDIDILIATDCISEGQNLQDCDTVLNYDIHWNPVRLIQRLGRIDRIGSPNEFVHMLNYWPHESINKYLRLVRRVHARMTLVSVSTGDINILEDPEEDASDDIDGGEVQRELDFRDRQLQEIKDGRNPDLDGQPGSVGVSELTLDRFFNQLMHHLDSRQKELEDAPLGIHAVVSAAEGAPPGAIFVLRSWRKGGEDGKDGGAAFYFVQTDGGGVCEGGDNVHTVLDLFSRLAVKETAYKNALCLRFNKAIENENGEAKFYHKMAKAAAAHVCDLIDEENGRGIRPGAPGGLLAKKPDHDAAKDFELVAWLVILTPEDGGKDKGGGGNGILRSPRPPTRSGNLIK